MALWYVRQIAVNVFYLAVVWLVLDQFNQRPEAVIMPVLGILYATIRGVGLGLGVLIAKAVQDLEDIRIALKDINSRVGQSESSVLPPVATELGGAYEWLKSRYLIETLFLCAICFLCLWKFLAALPGYQ